MYSSREQRADIMNKLSELFLNINNGDTLVLNKDAIYDVCEDDSFELEGYFCTNTAKKHENPNGMRKTAVFMKEKKNVTVDGNGATVLIHGKMTPLLFDKCENITVKNLTVDYACPTMAEFTVLSNESGICTIKINPECLFRIEGSSLVWQGECGKNSLPYWEDSYIGSRRHIKLFDPSTEYTHDIRRDDFEFEKIEQISSDTLRIHLKNKRLYLPAGSVIQSRNIVRDQTGSLFQRCKNLVFDSLRIKFMHGLGMVSQFCENVSYINCDLTPAPGRTAASTADFFQFSGCKGNLTVENCKARGAHDDYINFHGTHLRIIEKNDSKNSITVRFMHDESWGFQAFEAEDELEFIKWDTLIPYAKTKVKSYKKLNDTDILLFLDSPLPEIEIGRDVVENITWTPNLYVKNCNFGPTYGRGILCTTRGEVIIENNLFFKVRGPALLVEDDCNFWFESGLTKEIVFRNNKVINCDYSATWENAPVIRYTPKVMREKSEEYVHGKLVLTGNSFEKPKENAHCLWLEYLREAEITDNVFDAPYNIHSHCLGRVFEKNNVIK